MIHPALHRNHGARRRLSANHRSILHAPRFPVLKRAMKIILRDSPAHGRGVFATARLRPGELILTFTGPRLHRSEIHPDLYHLQVSEEWYLGPSGGLDDHVNHSCTPNSGFARGLDLVALRDIQPGEEITWDYSTAIDEDDFSGFPCACGTTACRGIVASFRNLAPAVQARLVPGLLPYLKEKYFGARPATTA